MRIHPAINLDTGAGVVALETPWGQLLTWPTAMARLQANALVAAADTADAAAELEGRVAGAGRAMLAQPEGRA